MKVLERREIEQVTDDPFEFLETSPLYPKWYWENREGTNRIAGLGCAHAQREVPVASDLTYFAGLPFIYERDPLWKDFHNQYYLPKLEWANKQLFTNTDDPFSFTFPKSARKELFAPYKRTDSPLFPQWQKNVWDALSLIDKKKLQKVVLARKTSFTFPSFLKPIQVLRKLSQVKGRGYLFFYQPTPDIAFLGASPESLYKRVGNQVYTEAVAGTRKRGKTGEEDETLRDELIRSPKDLKEFAIVEDHLQKTLLPHLENLTFEERKTILTTPYVQHLYSRLTGTLKKGSDELLLSLLHPTPATLGLPRDAAFDFLLQTEPFARGLYAGPIGWVNQSGAEFAVGIRSCLIEKNHAHLFAAAGILEGSNPASEWEELEAKMALFKHGVFNSEL